MYKKQNRDKQKDIRVVSLEDLVPRDHLLRKIDRAINFDFIYEEVKDLYSATKWGKPGIDPVSLFKIVLIQHLYGIRSMRQLRTVCKSSMKRHPRNDQAYIELNYEKEINRKDLSALVFLNPDYMDRVFKEQEGISVNRYINKVRMEKAQLLLEKTQMQVLEIADKVGYSSLSNFNMQFKQYCGLSPNQYRKRIRNR